MAITLKFSKFGSRYESHFVKAVIAGLNNSSGKLRSSCTYKPTMYNPVVNKIASSGVVKQENSSASATISASFNNIKYTATSTVASLRSSEIGRAACRERV